MVARPVKAEQPSSQPPFIDVKTGRLTPYGHRLLMGLFQRTGGFEDDLADLLVPSLLGEVSALQLADDQARIERLVGDAVTIARASLGEELEARIRALESPLNLPLSLAIARVAETAENLDALIRVLNGTTPFTALNILGTNVAPFFGYTDGSQITNVAAVTEDLLTPAFGAVTAGAVTWSASLAEQDLQEVTVTVERGAVRVVFQGDVGVITTASGWTGRLRLYRDATEITDAERKIRTIVEDGAHYQLPSQIALTFLDEPGAGTYDYRVTFTPGVVMSGDITNRTLTCDVGQG